MLAAATVDTVTDADDTLWQEGKRAIVLRRSKDAIEPQHHEQEASYPNSSS
jgi:hypothetical protein